MAVSGSSIGKIMQAGEWRSSAFLKYVGPDVLDGCELFNTIIDQSDEEAE